MVPKRRHVEPGCIYHVLNRGAQRQRLFFGDQDYSDFESLVEETVQEIALPILTYELMPNHWHFVVKPAGREQLSSFFQQVSGTHAKRYRVALQTVGEGHVYQDRFKSFPVESDGHLLSLCRYVERNARRAGLVERAEDWRWSGLWRRERGCDDWLMSAWPVPRPENWIERVNEPLTDSEIAAIRRSILRGTPLGNADWAREVAQQLGLQHTFLRAGRPRITSRKRG
jgi:putative transposase